MVDLLNKAKSGNGRQVRKLKDFSDGSPKIRTLKNVLSLVCGILIWWLLSTLPGVGVILAGPQDIIRDALPELLNDGVSGEFERMLLLKHIRWSFQRVFFGWAIAFICAIPVAFLMGWYRTFRDLLDPWIQFLRTIPPIALIPMVILLMGTGEQAKITVIFITSFLVMTVTIYQGVRNLDYTLVKAAYTFGAGDLSIFVRVVVPYAFPFILTAARLGVGQSTAGQGYEMDAIAAVIIGGASVAGGSGTVLGAVIGAAIMGVLNNGLVLLNVSAYWQQCVLGVVIVAAVSFDKLQNERKNKK